MTYSLDFAPHVPAAVLWLLTAGAAIVFGYSLVLRARGAWLRALAFAVAIFALANPLMVHETRQMLPDIVALIVDHSPSMNIDGRRAQADKAAAAIKAKLSGDKSLEIRTAEVTSQPGEDTGTQLFAALSSALSDAPPDRVAGAIAITDGEVHDAPTGKPTIHAPLQVLLVGKRGERDRKLTVVGAARYVIVGQTANITLRVDDFGSPPGGRAQVAVRIDGVDSATRTVPVGVDTHIGIPVSHGGENVVELEAKPGPAELGLQNNRAVVTINGVRDRLRVLLISGEPNAGERVWRSLLKADPAVDLVHFTILRPPTKQDSTPIDQLSLIIFPTRELFVDKLDSFDLIIFDRYSERGILPLAYFENIARYVENGGALLVTAGPEYAGPQSISRTPLNAVLPAQATGDVVNGPFKPMLTAEGLAHPVTRDLEGANTATTPPTWGKWFRLIDTSKVSGETLMSGPDGKPLLVLDRVGKGRVAELLSDQAWLWARGYDGGGPDAELLRRMAHWVMKEPELEEERLTATISGGEIALDRRSMAATVKPITLTYPSGKTITVQPIKIEPGEWRSIVKAGELGLYRATDGTLSAVAASGPLNPKEVSDMRATDAILKAPAAATGGSVHWLSDGMPDIRRVSPGSTAFGDDWIGLNANRAYRVTSVEQRALLPVWLALLLIVGSLLAAWRMEGR
ncbi:MAG TPA: hypothetical protein VHU87_07105 [Rhizomicrobium sp.]|jgi:hypothetical protein|nr:hypothetical protein [Rhizomicrobium sp.]